jgi:hypothetical protein
MPLEYDRLSNPDSPNKYHKHKVILYTLLSILPFCSIPEPQHLKNDFCHCQWVLILGFLFYEPETTRPNPPLKSSLRWLTVENENYVCETPYTIVKRSIMSCNGWGTENAGIPAKILNE